MLVLTSLMGDARQNRFPSQGLCFHAYETINFTKVMQCLNLFDFKVLWDPLVKEAV